MRARLVGQVIRRLGSPAPPSPVRVQDVLAADLSSPRSWSGPTLSAHNPLVVNWVMTPPSMGSGGHTTMFRLIRHLEAAGHTCRVYLYDVYGNRASDLEPSVRAFAPWLSADIGDVLDGMADAHAVFASSWGSAYPVYNDPCGGKRFYLVQDLEPLFYPRGGLSALAENTYRMGFHGITAGRWLPAQLLADYGMAADGFDFGCDTEWYHLEPGEARAGIACYARPSAPRRAHEVAVLALELFARRRPDITIHLYGDRIGKLPFPFVDHGPMTPAGLNAIYNRCFAGLSLSMTNVSLVPHEMLAAGCIPVVNDASHNRAVLDNTSVLFAEPNPHALADALVSVVDDPVFTERSERASASVGAASWDAAGTVVEQVLRRELGQHR